jgi:hypothetical protein
MLANAWRLTISGSSTIVQYTVVAFYMTAHEDDWELFRGEQAYADIQSDPSYKIVFIHTTAGDAGSIDGWWEAREQGAIAAVRAALPAQPLTFSTHSFTFHVPEAPSRVPNPEVVHPAPQDGIARRWASELWFPSALPSKLRGGVWLLPRWDCLPLNT